MGKLLDEENKKRSERNMRIRQPEPEEKMINKSNIKFSGSVFKPGRTKKLSYKVNKSGLFGVGKL